MIDPPLLAAFVVAAILLTLTPGVDTALVLRTALAEGRAPAVRAALGIAAGCLLWALAVSLGLGALLAASELAFAALKLAGAAYLLWLGLRHLLRPRGTFELEGAGQDRRQAFVRGLTANLLNPKVGIFYVSFLPQFVPRGADLALGSFLLACIHVGLSLGWFALLIGASGAARRAFGRPGAVRWLDRISGLVFVGFGARLALATRA